MGTLYFLVCFGLLLSIGVIVRPYRDRPDLVGRNFARWLWEVKPQETVLVRAWEDLDLDFARPRELWIPGDAGYRINQQIYGRSHFRDATDLRDVSPQRPLCVLFLGTAPEKKRSALEEWLAEIETTHRLVGHEVHSFAGFKEQHGRAGWLELFLFAAAGDTGELPNRVSGGDPSQQ